MEQDFFKCRIYTLNNPNVKIIENIIIIPGPRPHGSVYQWAEAEWF